MATHLSTVEKMLNGEFSGNPDHSRFPLPEVPKETPDGVSYTHSGFVVTPEMAREWVLHRTVRRDVIPPHKMHADVIPNRKYLITYAKSTAKNLQDPDWWNRGIHQGLAFTWDGYILDGQHRLLACALSGTTIILPVAVNVPWSAFRDIDQNRSRHAHQMIDLPYDTVVTATARYLLPLLRDEWESKFTYSGKENDDDVIDISLGWPYFAEDQPWSKEISEASKECGLSNGALGSVVIGSLASGVPADEVQQFINGLRPLTRKVTYETIGTSGHDPRQLLARLARNNTTTNNGRRRRKPEIERGLVGATRQAMRIWLARHTERPIKVSTAQLWSSLHDLPVIGDPKVIRAFHNEHVN